MVHCNMKLIWQSSYALTDSRAFQPGGVANLDRRAHERRTCSRLNLRTSSRESCRAVTLPVTRIIVSSRIRSLSSWDCIAAASKINRLLRPAFQRGMSGLGQGINAALGAIEPAIDIVQQDLPGVGNRRPQVAHVPRSA
jgi:hypothetical protein